MKNWVDNLEIISSLEKLCEQLRDTNGAVIRHYHFDTILFMCRGSWKKLEHHVFVEALNKGLFGLNEGSFNTYLEYLQCPET